MSTCLTPRVESRSSKARPVFTPYPELHLSQDPTKLERARLREGLWLGQKYRLGQLIALDELCASYFAASTSGRVVEANILNPELANLGTFNTSFILAARTPNALGLPAFGSVQDSGTTDDGLPYFISSELGEGESLGDLVRRRGRTIPPSEALRIIGNLLAALAVAHTAGIAHGLVEPNHIFLGEDGSFKIRGLGMSALRIAAIAALKLRAPWQTIPFVAPEVVRGEQPSPSSDIWSAGAVLFSLLTGELPYAATGEALLSLAAAGETLILSELEPKAPQALVTLVANAMHPVPAQRTASAVAFGSKARALSETSQICLLRFLGDSQQSRGSGPWSTSRGPAVPVRLASEAPEADTLPPKATPARVSLPPGRPSGGYSQITNVTTSVSLSGMQRVSNPPPPLNRAGGTLHTQSTRPPKRG